MLTVSFSLSSSPPRKAFSSMSSFVNLVRPALTYFIMKAVALPDRFVE